MPGIIAYLVYAGKTAILSQGSLSSVLWFTRCDPVIGRCIETQLTFNLERRSQAWLIVRDIGRTVLQALPQTAERGGVNVNVRLIRIAYHVARFVDLEEMLMILFVRRRITAGRDQLDEPPSSLQGLVQFTGRIRRAAYLKQFPFVCQR